MFSECGGIIMFACGVGVFTYATNTLEWVSSSNTHYILY